AQGRRRNDCARDRRARPYRFQDRARGRDPRAMAQQDRRARRSGIGVHRRRGKADVSYAAIHEILRDLVAFDTTSHRSNLPLIEYVRAYLARHGVECDVMLDAQGEKANLWATIGKPGADAIVLSGHTD